MAQQSANSMIEGTHVELSGGQYTQYNGNIQHIHQHSSEKRVQDILLAQVSRGASYNSDERYDAPKCHPDTRVAVLNDLITRVTTAVVACIIWLHGPAGAGKSAIAQSVAENCAAQALLLGSFFFFRASDSRNTVKPLAATLVYQLTQYIPSTRPYVLDCISRDETIFHTHLENQLIELFLEPLRQAMIDDPTSKSRPRVIVIDGLDECHDPKVQKMILNVFEKILSTCPIPLVILVASRPENNIRSSFDTIDMQSRVPLSRIGLHEQAEASQDIRLFLYSKFSTIRRTHPLRTNLPPDWPTPADINKLVQRSSGQFIYAATIVRYVESDQHNPGKRLQAALNAPQRTTEHGSPFEALDALYTQIFSSVSDHDLIATLAILYLRFRPVDKDRNPKSSLHNTGYYLRLDTGTVHEHLSPLASLVKISEDRHDLHIFHASLEDFLFDAARSQTLYADQSAVHYLLCNTYFAHATGQNAPLQLTYCAMKRLILHALKAGEGNLINNLGHVADVEMKLLGVFSPPLRYKMQLPEINRWRLGPSGVRLDDLIQILHDFLTFLDPGLDAQFWGNWIQKYHHLLIHELSDFLKNDHQNVLAFIAFMDADMWGVESSTFAPTLGVTHDQWLGYENQFHRTHHSCFIHLPSQSKHANDVIRKFLRSKELSGDLYIGDSAFVRLAVHCATLIRMYPGKWWPDHRNKEDNMHWWGVRGLACMLQFAPANPSLVKEIRRLDIDTLPHYCGYGSSVGVRDEIQAYLEKPENNLGFRSRVKHGVRTVIQKFS